MTRLVSKAENWQRVYQAFSSINFTAFDYNSVKKSLVDYLKIYHPESFSDYIESSELITIVEAFSYASELFAYRLDQNANENLITTAQRRESILRLAKLLSYSVSRNIPSRGLVKINSITSTERVFDSRGNDLSNKIITWNDPNNANWKEQFLLVINKVLAQDFGSVTPSDRIQIEDVLIELYQFNNNPLLNNVLSYQINIANQSFPMEIVSCQLNQYGPFEMRPQKSMALTILYLSDGLGDASDNTGFFLFTKQGSLQRLQTSFDGITPNQTYDVLVNNINQTDVWLNNINPDTGLILSDSNLLSNNSGEWIEVDITNAQNIVFNTNPIRNKYELETLDNDQIRFIFGDGNFANIPNGTFELWFRNSANLDYIIPTSSLQNVGASFNYFDSQGKEQTLALTFSLLDPIQNSAPSEDLEHIRKTAPSVYYTQDRMVNGRDYNEFMLQDNSILKLQAINRTFSGDSKYIFWHDASNYYENVKIFGDDLVVYFTTEVIGEHISGANLPAPDGGSNANLVNALIYNYIQPILSTNEFYVNAILNDGAVSGRIKKTFSGSEIGFLQIYLNNLVFNVPETLYLVYDGPTNTWSFTETAPARWDISVTSNQDNSWDINYYSKKLILHSDETKFWVNNNGQKIITLDTFNSNLDRVIILSANVAPNDTLLGLNHQLNVVQQLVVDVGVDQGTFSNHDLLAIPDEQSGDGITLSYLINAVLSNGPVNYVYFNRACVGTCPWVFQPATSENIQAFNLDQETNPVDKRLWKREIGVENVNFLWLHSTPRYHLIDPSPSNIIDMFIIPRGYYTAYKQWLAGELANPPTLPTNFELRASYNYLLDNKMISDSLILHPGKIKLLFGPNADTTVQGKFLVVKSPNSVMTDNQIKTVIAESIRNFFDINLWEFGETFYFTELAAYIHTQLPADISAVVLVPLYQQNIFGDLFQIFTEEDEILQAQVEVPNIEIVQSLDPLTIKQYS